MKAFCTYCSCSKSREPCKVPAIQRYLSGRIHKVYEAASILELPFFVLSGRFGLVEPQQQIPFYEHLLGAEEVADLAELVMKQIRECRVEGFVYFTKPVVGNANLQPYYYTLATACTRLSLPLCTVELKESNMSSWRAIMEVADAAKINMISDRAGGEKAFESLLKQNPRDGMIYFKRGEAYEAIGEKPLAAADFQRAMALFPKAEWKARAKEAWDRVKS